ncbi:hypothetical protein GCM10020255_027100 [Rhodococcus baikonurensis]
MPIVPFVHLHSADPPHLAHVRLRVLPPHMQYRSDQETREMTAAEAKYILDHSDDFAAETITLARYTLDYSLETDPR